jgi:DNA-binding transcriptional regulator LsrR (DeoR family)
MVQPKITSTDNTAMIVQVARMYYDEELSQQEIADKLKISRSSIAQYLRQAREFGIVRIEVVNPADNCENMALEIKKHTRLDHVHVVPGIHQYRELTMRAIASEAANYLEKILCDGDVLGLAWGRTITRLASLLAPSAPKKVEVVPLMGERDYTGNYSQINQIVLQTTSAIGGTPYFLLAPMIVGSQKLRDDLIKDTSIREVVQRWERLTVSVIGIGAIPPQEGSIVYVGERYMQHMQDNGAVGDVCGRYFDLNGNLIDAEFYDRMISIDLDQLRNVKTVVAVAGGIEKTQAVLSSIKTGIYSVLIIDEMLAQNLLENF